MKVPRPLVALALAKNLDSVGPRCELKPSINRQGPVLLVGAGQGDSHFDNNFKIGYFYKDLLKSNSKFCVKSTNSMNWLMLQ